MNDSAHILIVDDNETNRQLLVDLLQPMGYRLSEAIDGKDAIAEVHKGNPDIVLMDINMPIMDGLTATKHLREDPRFKSLPVIIVTAYNEPTYRRQAAEAGCSAYIKKPVDIPRLYGVIEELIPH